MSVADHRASAAPAEPRVLAISDEQYPPLLRAIHDPPPKLYVRGDPKVLQQPLLAIVGSRRASSAGLRLAELLAGRLTAAGLNICSGLALGIDGAAHRGALAAQGSSVAVMASGIDRIYPARHRRLGEELACDGALVTEFEPGTPPLKGNFPRRNRIISGLSLGVLVVEAALPSGSLITAGTAIDQGREVFTLPWSILHEGGSGCLKLLRDGAKMVQSVDDILEELGPMYSLQQELFDGPGGGVCQPPDLSSNLRKVLQLIGFEEVSVDELSRLADLPAAGLLADLSELELAGLIERGPGGYIRCC